MVKLTDGAAKALHGMGGKLVLELERGGCAEYKYKFRLSGSSHVEYEAYDIDFADLGELRVSIPVSDTDKLGGVEIDYVKTIVKRGFVVKSNPYAEEKCGCGISFR